MTLLSPTLTLSISSQERPRNLISGICLYLLSRTQLHHINPLPPRSLHHASNRRPNNLLPLLHQPSQRARARPPRYIHTLTSSPRSHHPPMKRTDTTTLSSPRPQNPHDRKPRRRLQRPRLHRLHRQRHLHPLKLPLIPSITDAVVGAQSGQ